MATTMPSGDIGYRQRIYDNYVSAFKGRPSRNEVGSEFERRSKVYDYLLSPVLEHCNRGLFLEVACGQGALLYWARQKRFREIHGCDLSAEQVAVAAEMGLPVAVRSYREFLPQFRGKSDLVVGMDIIEHLDRDEAFELLDLCCQSLRPGGHLFLTLPNAAAYRPGPVQAGDLTHETAYSPQSITVALRLAGFVSTEIREVCPPATSWRARGRRVLWKFIRLWPQLVDLVETGAASRVLTRVMAVTAVKPAQAARLAFPIVTPEA